MEVTASSLTAPVGELDPAILFPADDEAAFTARCDAWIAEGTAKADAITDPDRQGQAITLWCYARAYEAVALRMTVEPATQRLDDQGSTGWSTAQLAAIQALAAERRAAVDALLAAPVAVDTPPAGRLPSATTAGVATW